MATPGGLKHVSTEPAHLDNKRERRGRGAAGRAAALRRAPSDSDCSGETASLSADSADRVRTTLPPPRQTKARRRRGSEWEVLEGLKDGQRFERRPEVFNGYLHKKRKWPLKGWHKRFFVVDGGILVYARSPTDVARGRLHGSVDVGLSVISAKARRRRIDIDADEFIYHLRAKTADVFRTWLNVLKAHRLYRQHLLTFGARESVPKIHAPLDDLAPTDTSSLSALTSFVSDSSRTDSDVSSIKDDLKVIKSPSLTSPPDSIPFPVYGDTVNINKNLVKDENDTFKDDHATYKNLVTDWDVKDKDDNITYRSLVKDWDLSITPKDDCVTYKNPDNCDNVTYKSQVKDSDVTHKGYVTNKHLVEDGEVTHKGDNVTYEIPVKDLDVTHKGDNVTYKDLVTNWKDKHKYNHVTSNNPVKNSDVKRKDEHVTFKNPLKNWHSTPKEGELTPDFDLPFDFDTLDDIQHKSNEKILNPSLCSVKCLQLLHKQEIQKYHRITGNEKAELSTILDEELPLSVCGVESNLFKDDEISDITIPPVVPTFSDITPEENKQINERKVIHVPPLFKNAAKNIFFLSSHKNKTGSQILKKSKKSTNISKYQNVIPEPPLEKPLRRVVIRRNKINVSTNKMVRRYEQVGKDFVHIKKADGEVQVENLILKETKSQNTITELDHSADKLAKSFLEIYSLLSQGTRFEQCVTQVIKELHNDNKSNISTSPVIIVFKDLFDYWLSTYHPKNIQCKEDMNNAFRNKLTDFQSVATQFERATKDETVSTVDFPKVQKSEAIQTPSKWEGVIDEESQSPPQMRPSFLKEQRIQEIEKLVKNTMYETEYEENYNTKIKNNKMTRNLIKPDESPFNANNNLKNMPKISTSEHAQQVDKENTAIKYKKIQKILKSFITETSVPPAIVKAYLQILIRGVKDSNKISEELKEQNDLQNIKPNFKGESIQKTEYVAVLTENDVDKTEAIKDEIDESTQDSNQTVLKELFSTIANYFNSYESINKYKIDQYVQPDDIKAEGSISSHITLQDREDNSLVLDLTKYCLDNISVLSEPREEISITIKPKEPLTNRGSINQNKLNIRFSDNKPKPINHIIEQNSGDSKTSSASYRRSLNSVIGFKNPYIDLEPLSLGNKMQLTTVSESNIATYKAYRKTCKTKPSNKITDNHEVNKFSNTQDYPKTCYILSDLKKRAFGLINKKDVTKEHTGGNIKPSEFKIKLSNPDSKLKLTPSKSGLNRGHDELTIKLSQSGLKQENSPTNNSKSKTIIDEKFILSLLENLTLLSKHVPSFYKDINALFVKLKKRHDKKMHKESTLGLLGEIYNSDQVTEAVKTQINAVVISSELAKVNQLQNSVCAEFKEVLIHPKNLKDDFTDAYGQDNEAQTELMTNINEKSYNHNKQHLKNIATPMSDLNLPLSSDNLKTSRLEKVVVKRMNEKFESNDSNLENDDEFDLSEVLRNLFNMSTSDVNFNFVLDENKNSYKSVPKRLNVTKLIAPNNARISKTRETVAHKKSRKKDYKLNIENEITIEYQKSVGEYEDTIEHHTPEKTDQILLLPHSLTKNKINRKQQLDETDTDTFTAETTNLDKDLNVCFHLMKKISRSVPFLCSYSNESGGPLENASRELGQAQLSVQQLQRLLESLELQHHHHDTDQVSLEGASPNVKKDRRKFGLRKKKSNSKCASVELAPPIDPSNSHMALSALTAPPSPGGASSVPNSAASLPIACAATRPVSLPGAEALSMGGVPPLAPLTPDHQLREDFTVLAKDLVATLNTVLATLVCERGRLRSAMEAAETGTPGGAVVAALRTNLTTALHQNSELRSRLSRIHDASDLAEICSVNTDAAARPFPQQQSLSYSSSCVSASEFFDAEEHGSPPPILPADEPGVIELDGDSSSEAGSLSSEDASASSDNSDGALLSAEPVSLTVSTNGVCVEAPSGWSRRVRLPCPRPTPGGPSLWNLLYKNIGKDLSQVSMPVTINEPLNMLQRLCEELEYSELLDAAAECGSGLERMALIAAFAVSAYAASAHRAASKPFNPLLAETYECVRGDKGFKFLAEQVSHHPPISACHAQSARWVLWQEARIKTKFWGKSMEFQPAGRVHVRLLTTGDHYSWNKVTTCVHNLFGGQRWVDQYGDMLITNHGNDITAKLNFIKASSWSSSRHEVRGWVSDGLGGRLRLQGRWSEALYAGEPPTARCLWRPGAMPPEHELYYGFTRFAMELNEMEPGLRELLPHTDTRLRPDQRALEEGDVDAAERYKLQLEQAQRDRRSHNDLHTPAWFRKAYEDGEEMWVFTGEYWRARDSGFPELRAPAIW